MKYFFYTLQLNLEAIYAESKQLDKKVRAISNGTIPNDILEIRWPLGVPPESAPETRHDLLAWSLMNETHHIMPNFDDNVKELSKVDQEDIKVTTLFSYGFLLNLLKKLII